MSRPSPSDDVIAFYERHAETFNRERGRSLRERSWLDRFLSFIPEDGAILDLGCGCGEPIDGYLIDAGCRLTGIDSSPRMVAMCRDRFPDHAWRVGDMRTVKLGERFAGILAWDSFFHLPPMINAG